MKLFVLYGHKSKWIRVVICYDAAEAVKLAHMHYARAVFEYIGGSNAPEIETEGAEFCRQYDSWCEVPLK